MFISLSDRRALLLLLCVAVLIRITYFLEYAGLPFLLAPLFDSSVYLRQATSILEGRFGDATLLAFSPLYGYYLALFGAGHWGDVSLVLPVLGQFVLGCVTMYLLYRTSTGLFGRLAAVFSCLLYLGYGNLLFYESKLLSETLGMLLAFSSMALYLKRGFAQGLVRPCVACGAVVGMAVLARASLLFSAPMFVLCALLPWQRPPALAVALRLGLRRAALCAAGLALVLGGNGLWNLRNTDFFVPVIFASKTVVMTTKASWRGNLADLSSDGSGRVGPWDVVHQAEERLQKRSAGLKDPPSFLRSIDLRGWLRGSPKKLVLTFLDLEMNSFQYGYYGEHEELKIFRLLPISFGTIMLCGLLGAVFIARRRGLWSIVPYLPYVLGTLLLTTFFHPSSRYRLGLVVPMLILSGFGITEVLRLTDRRRRLLAGGVLLLLCLVLAYRTLSYQLRDPSMYQLIVAQSAVKKGDYDEALRRIKRARQLAHGDASVEQYIHEVIGLKEGY